MKSSDIRNNNMKKEYDFSKGTRGKFYRKNLKFNLPVYLDDDNLQFIEKIAKKKKADLSSASYRG